MSLVVLPHIRRAGIVCPLFSQKQLAPDFLPWFEDAKQIDIAPVWAMMAGEATFNNALPSGFSLTPPFTSTLLEYAYDSQGVEIRLGALLCAADLNNNPPPLTADFPLHLYGPDLRWAVTCFLVQHFGAKGTDPAVVMPLMLMAFGLDGAGVPLSSSVQADPYFVIEFAVSGKDGQDPELKKCETHHRMAMQPPVPRGLWLTTKDGSEPTDGELADITFSAIMRCLLTALGLLNCKNVVLDERLPSRQVRRAAERSGQTVDSFYTLRVEAPGTSVVGRKVEDNGAAPDPKRLHICRGHFSTYSEERPLFGKWAGTFWIPAHVRGSAKAGQIVKNYVVHPRKEPVNG